MALAPKGIDVRLSGSSGATKLLIDAFFEDASGALSSGTATYRLFELQDDGTLKSYDFNDNTFKTTALTTPTASLTHRQGDNNTYNTGIWTASLATLTGFTVNGVYYAQAVHSSGGGTLQTRKFQYGGGEGDFDNLYTAVVQFTRDQSNTRDEYTVTWLKNGTQLTSGVTSPTINVKKRVDGSNLVAATAMTSVGSGIFTYDEATNRVTVGEACLVITQATIDGATRTSVDVIGRDSV